MRRRRILARRPTVEPRALILILAASLAMIGLTFRTWIDFNVTHLRGTDADAITGVGDGYIVIALAGLAIACTVALYLRPKLWSILLPGVGVASVGIAVVAAYQAVTPWHAAGFDARGAFVAGGHATAAVYEILALAAVSGIAAGLLATLHYQRQRREASERVIPPAWEGTRSDQANSRAAGRLGPR